jgi:hypothetical protein
MCNSNCTLHFFHPRICLDRFVPVNSRVWSNPAIVGALTILSIAAEPPLRHNSSNAATAFSLPVATPYSSNAVFHNASFLSIQTKQTKRCKYNDIKLRYSTRLNSPEQRKKLMVLVNDTFIRSTKSLSLQIRNCLIKQ